MDPVLAVLAPRYELAVARRGDARRRGADEHAGGGRLDARHSARARWRRGRVRPVRTEAVRGAALPRSAARARAQAVLRRSVRRALLPARSGVGRVAASRIRGAGRARERPRPRRRRARARRGRAAFSDRTAAHVCVLPRQRHGTARNRLLGGSMSISSFTSVLIWLPMAGALAIWALPLSRYATGSLAVLVSLAEVGLWIEQAARFDFTRSGLQFSQNTPWFKDLHVSYHVGEYAFSLWLVGLTVVAMSARIGYGFWVGRHHP